MSLSGVALISCIKRISGSSLSSSPKSSHFLCVARIPLTFQEMIFMSTVLWLQRFYDDSKKIQTLFYDFITFEIFFCYIFLLTKIENNLSLNKIHKHFLQFFLLIYISIKLKSGYMRNTKFSSNPPP